MALDCRRLEAAALVAALPDIAALRISVFRDWPYLYDGDHAYEESYLARYAEVREAVVIGAFDGPRLVGASTGMPLVAHADDFAAAFSATDFTLKDVFYCAESVLLPDYRGQGVGHAFFDQREDAARSFGYSISAFCAVIRPDIHPSKPETYRPLDGFWRARGYRPLADVVATFAWKDLGDAEETYKELQFWSRLL